MLQAKRYQIICDLTDCNEKIKERESVREFLEGLVKMVNMSILEVPIIAEGVPENPGISGLVIIDYCLNYFGVSKENSRIKEVWWG